MRLLCCMMMKSKAAVEWMRRRIRVASWRPVLPHTPLPLMHPPLCQYHTHVWYVVYVVYARHVMMHDVICMYVLASMGPLGRTFVECWKLHYKLLTSPLALVRWVISSTGYCWTRRVSALIRPSSFSMILCKYSHLQAHRHRSNGPDEATHLAYVWYVCVCMCVYVLVVKR